MLSATQDFNSALVEVNILITYATRNTSNINKYATFNKSAIILLCAKFEAFVEEFLEEYAYECCNRTTNKSIDSPLMNHILDCLISNLDNVKNNTARRRPVLNQISSLVESSTNPMNGFTVDSKFSFGKHGQRELTKLLTKFGYKTFNETKTTEGFYRLFNSLFNIRNNIIHEDATPTLTHRNVRSYKDLLEKFVEDIDNLGQSRIDAL